MGTLERVRILTAAIVTLAVVAVSASAAPQGFWVQPATDLSVSGEDAEYPQIATAPDGTTTVVWSRNDGSNYIVQSATRLPGGGFGSAANLSVSGKDAARPQIAAAPDGTVTVVWSRSNGSNDIIQAATRLPGGSFGSPFKLSANGGDAYGPQIATAPDGTTTVVWSRNDGSNDIIQSATRLPGGSFGSPFNLSANGQSADDPQIATAPDGTTTVVWMRSNGSNTIVQAATRLPGGSFGPAVNRSANGRNADDPQIATAADGTTTVVWSRNDGSNDIIQSATRLPGGGFGSAVNLSVSGKDAEEPQIATAPDGTTTVVWSRIDVSKAIVQATTRPPGGGFGSAISLSAAGQDAFHPQIATAPDGTASAVWARDDGSNNIIQSISTAQPYFTLGVAKGGAGNGSVTSSPSGVNCGSDCAQSYPSFTKVTLTATPDSGDRFRGWGGACENVTGSVCQLIMLDDENATANFDPSPPPPAGKAKLKVKKVKPKKPKVKRGHKVKIKVTVKNSGSAKASSTKLCLKLNKSVKKKLKPSGGTCQTLCSLAAGKVKTKSFKLKATGKARRGKKYKVTFKLTAHGTKTAKRAVKVKVKKG